MPLLACGARALLCIAAPLPSADKPLISVFGMSGEFDLAVAQLLDVVCIGGAALVAFPRRLAGLQFHCPQLIGDQRRPCPLVIDLFGQQTPAQHGQLAGDRRNLVAAAGTDAQKEGAQRTRAS
jgi:hypothetical protein